MASRPECGEPSIGADVDAFVGVADAAAPRGLEGDLDAVIVGVPQVDGLGDEVVGGRDADAALQGAHHHLRQVGAGRDVDGDVVEAEAVIEHRVAGAEFEGDQLFPAGAEVQGFGILGDQFEADDVAPDEQGLVAVGDGDAGGAERAW